LICSDYSWLDYQKKDPFIRDLNHLRHIMLKKFSLNKTLLIYLLLFLSNNLLSYFSIIDAWLIIMYLTIYVFFIFSYKKKFEKPS
jgi:Ca2+/Na+ antiporter